VYTDTRQIIEFDISNRLTALKEIIAEASHKIVIFCPFRNSIKTLATELTKLKITNDIINGDVTMLKRSQIFKNFQEKKDPHVLIIQPQAASHGVTLHAANVVVFWSPVMSVETYIQCCARIDRAGQKNPMTVVHLLGSPVENKVYKMLQGKVDNHTKLVDLYREELGLI
jgi:SNF2 family DNA or RNA helicase